MLLRLRAPGLGELRTLEAEVRVIVAELGGPSRDPIVRHATLGMLKRWKGGGGGANSIVRSLGVTPVP